LRNRAADGRGHVVWNKEAPMEKTEADAMLRAIEELLSVFATTEIHPLRRDVEQLFEHVRGNGRPGLVQQVAILEERDRATLRQLEQAHVAIERLQQRLYMLVAGVGLSLLGAVLSFVLR
jgi:glycine cleavage system regulatory protein